MNLKLVCDNTKLTSETVTSESILYNIMWLSFDFAVDYRLTSGSQKSESIHVNIMVMVHSMVIVYIMVIAHGYGYCSLNGY